MKQGVRAILALLAVALLFTAVACTRPAPTPPASRSTDNGPLPASPDRRDRVVARQASPEEVVAVAVAAYGDGRGDDLNALFWPMGLFEDRFRPVLTRRDAVEAAQTTDAVALKRPPVNAPDSGTAQQWRSQLTTFTAFAQTTAHFEARRTDSVMVKAGANSINFVLGRDKQGVWWLLWMGQIP